ncbi:MAG: hypothetical protein WB709_12905 [Solirubrobacteraceae bacterium]
MRTNRIAGQYSKHMRSRFGLWPTWLPDSLVTVGDFGRIEGGVFMREGHLNVNDARSSVDSQSYSDQLFASQGVRHAVAGSEALGMTSGVRVAARIEFGRAFGVFVALCECREQRIADMVSTAATMQRRREEGNWTDAHCLVTGLIHAESALIAIGADSGARIEIEAGQSSLDILGMLRNEIRISSEVSVGYRGYVTAGCTPLLRLSRLTSPGELIPRGRSQARPLLVSLDASAEETHPPSDELTNDPGREKT